VMVLHVYSHLLLSITLLFTFIHIFCDLIIDLDERYRLPDNEDIFFEILEPHDISYTYRVKPAKDFGTAFNKEYKKIYLIPTAPLKSCGQLTNRFLLAGNVALVERGECSFVTKSIYAQESGANAVLIFDNERTTDDRIIYMLDDQTNRSVNIPVMFITYKDGHMILDSIKRTTNLGALVNIPLNLSHSEIMKATKAPWSYWL